MSLSHSAQIKALPIPRLVPSLFAIYLQTQFVFSDQRETGPQPILTLTADSSCETIRDFSDFCDLLAALRRSQETASGCE